MRRVLPSIMVILVCLSNGMLINTDFIGELDIKHKRVTIVGTRFPRSYEVTDEDIQKIKDAMGVYEKEEGE